MEREALRFLASRLKLAYFPSGAELLGPRDGVAARLSIVKQGVVKGTPCADTRSDKLVDHIYGPGEMFPIDALLGERATAFEFRAERDVFVWELSGGDFRALLDRSIAFQHYCTNRLSSLLEQSRRTLRAHAAEAILDESRMLQPLRLLARHEPLSCAPDTPIRDVLESMHARRVGSMVIVNPAHAPLGIFTQPDVLSRVALGGADLHSPISDVMTARPILLPADAPAYMGALAMARHGIRHIVLVDDGKLAGVVSERDLFALQRVSLRRTADRIRAAADATTLADAATELRELAGSLLAQGFGAEHLTQVVSAMNDSVVARAVELSAARHPLSGRFCWIALGSEGRMEQTLATDQDNALILESRDDAPAALEMAAEVNATLDACGFPLCKGGIMARNPKWCLTLDDWRGAFQDWIRNTDPEALLNSAIFFDLRALAGEPQFADELRGWLLERTASSSGFLRGMASNALQAKPPIGLLRDFVTDDSPEHPGTIDLKKLGVRPFVDAARIWALARHSPQTSTAERLRTAAHAGVLPAEEAAAAVDAFHFLQTLRLRHQHFGHPAAGAENRIDPAALNALDRRILKEAFRHAAKLQERLRLDYQL